MVFNSFMYVHVHVTSCIRVSLFIRLDVHCMCIALPYLAYITVDLNPANWAASVAQLAEHWTSNPVVTGSNPIRGRSVFFSLSAFGLWFPLFNLHIHVRD